MSEMAKTTVSRSIRGQLQQALDAILWQGKSWDEAASEVGLSCRSMRIAMGRADVIKYLRNGVKERLAASQARALHALDQIMSNNDQMPGVQAAKTVLGLTFDDNQTKQTSPGVVIQIISDSNTKSVTDIKPILDQHGQNHHDQDRDE